MNAIQILGDPESVLAFALGGVPGHVATTAEAARAALAGAARAVAAGGGPVQHPLLLLVTHGTARLIRDELNQVALDPLGPLVLEIPGFADPLGVNPVERFVQRVLGGYA